MTRSGASQGAIQFNVPLLHFQSAVGCPYPDPLGFDLLLWAPKIVGPFRGVIRIGNIQVSVAFWTRLDRPLLSGGKRAGASTFLANDVNGSGPSLPCGA